MMSVLPTNGPARRNILTPYVMLWMAVASFALAYVALLGMSPQMLTSTAQTSPGVDEMLAQTRRDMERGLADLDPLRRTVGEVKMDVANLKIAVQEATDRDRAILDKVGSLQGPAPQEPEAAQPTEAPHTPEAMIPPTPRPDPRKSAGAKAPTVITAAATPDPKSHNAKLANGGQRPEKTQEKAAPKKAAQEKASGIETGSIARAATSPPPPAPTVNVPAAAKPAPPPKPVPVGMLVATGPSLDALRLNWSILTDRHGDTVRNLHPRYVVTGSADKRTYGLVVGPVGSTAEAKSVCRAMQSRGQDCRVSAYRGNAL